MVGLITQEAHRKSIIAYDRMKIDEEDIGEMTVF